MNLLGSPPQTYFSTLLSGNVASPTATTSTELTWANGQSAGVKVGGGNIVSYSSNVGGFAGGIHAANDAATTVGNATGYVFWLHAVEVSSITTWENGNGGTNLDFNITPNGNPAVDRRTTALTLGQNKDVTIYGNAFKPTAGGWTAGSDLRCKSNIQSYEFGLAEINKLEVVRFEYNGKYKTLKGCKSIGLIAQECIKIIPDAVTSAEVDDVQDFLYLTPDAVYWAAIKAIQELSTKVEALETRLTALENK